jgi:hypothetical protein
VSLVQKRGKMATGLYCSSEVMMNCRFEHGLVVWCTGDGGGEVEVAWDVKQPLF